MKPALKLKRYFNEKIDTINVFLRKPAGKYNSDDFHRLRVEIKKIKALFVLLEKCSKKKDPKFHLKPFNVVFKAAGKVRELQVEKAILKKYYSRSIFNRYLIYLIKSERKAKSDFFSILKRHPEVIAKKEVIQSINEIGAQRLNRYIEKEEKKINRITNGKTIKPKAAHKLRRQLKALYYNKKSINLSGKGASLKKQEALQELLGRWHDYEVLHKKTKMESHNKNWNKSEKEKLIELKSRFEAQHKKLFKRIKAVRLKI